MTDEKFWSGVAKTPSLTADKGQTFGIRGRRLAVQTTGTDHVNDLGGSDGTILALVVQEDERMYVWGTAFIVGPGVALAASHVIHEHFKEGQLKNEGGALLAVGIRADGSLQIWNGTHVTFIDQSDIAILSISAFSDFKSGDNINVVECSVVSPKVGERVTVLGFTASEISFDASAPVGIAQIASKGEVLDVFEAGRGSHYPGPCFAAAITSVGGMSGSPVMNEAGLVIGILSGSVASPDNDGYSMVSLLRTAMVHTFPGQWPPGFHKEGSDLRTTTGVFTHGLERISVKYEPGTDQKIISYRFET